MPLLTIVGMGKGISSAVAERFGREGFDVAMIGRKAEALAGYAAQLGTRGISAKGYPADAGDPVALKTAFDHIHSGVAPTDVLVYNAAAVHRTPVLAETNASLVKDFRVNVAGALEAALLVLPGMQARKQGTILFTGGGLALAPADDYVSLSIGKAGIRILALTLAQSTSEFGIHVATVTVCGLVSADSETFNPTAIAEQYWALHQQAPKEFQAELVIK